MISKKCYFR